MSERTVPAPTCPICQTALRPTFAACPGCGTALRWREGIPIPRPVAVPVAPPPSAVPAPRRVSPRTLGLLGAALLAAGTVLPVAQLPGGGSLAYLNGGAGDGLVALLLAAVAAPAWGWIVLIAGAGLICLTAARARRV